MVKIFIGNLANDTTIKELRALFEKYGTVNDCDILKNFGFVHMSSMADAEEAIKNLHQTELNGWAMNVELSKGKPRASAKLHVTNLSEEVTTEQLWAQFEEFGPVLECDIVKTYAFVHMARMEDALEAINKLDNKAFQGKLMKVQMSTSRLRTAAGMGDYKGCYVCGKQGHWWKSCPNDDSDGARSESSWFPPHLMASPPAADYRSSSAYSQASYSGRLPPPPPPPPPPRFSSYGSNQGGWYASRAAGSYADRSEVYSRNHLYSSVNYYDKYRAHYGSSQMEKRYLSYIPPPPPPTSSLSKLTSSTNPYDHRPLAPSSSASMYYTREPITHAPSSSSSSAAVYYTREPITQAPSSSTSYILERKRLSPQPASRSSYPALRPKDPYAQRYAPY
ncbi:RNA-binding protein 4.1 [Nematolebias whitei]|uniref:RNA-binding protein 4.1 n=1 Tax=Nematolebias whitei TaxID=451745 RepID=UPI0018970F7A|nr:RNA-binding protein 4.1 [Nematolebias whitei]